MNYYSLINTPVIQHPSRRKMGAVSDVFLRKDSLEIRGIVATNRSLIYQNRLFYISDILYADTNAVIVCGTGRRFIKSPNDSECLSFKRLLGQTAMSDNSTSIGTVKDGYFDMEAGSLTELLIGGSLADDLLHGRKRLIADSIREENGVVMAKNPALLSRSKGLRALSVRSKYDKSN